MCPVQRYQRIELSHRARKTTRCLPFGHKDAPILSKIDIPAQTHLLGDTKASRIMTDTGIVMLSPSRPHILISKCLGIAPCRYDGRMTPFPFVDILAPHAELVTICPECEIGLGTPRKPIRIVQHAGNDERLIQPASGHDLTKAMRDFTTKYLDGIGLIDGAIMRSRSPSCGVGDTKVFASPKSLTCLHDTGTGFFTRELQERFPHIPISDEEQLADPLLRDHFLTRAFVSTAFRDVVVSGNMDALRDYHSRNELLFLSRDRDASASMGRLVSEDHRFEDIIDAYGHHLRALLTKRVDIGLEISVLRHVSSQFYGLLDIASKRHIEALITRLNNEPTLLFELKRQLLHYLVHFNIEGLMHQSYFCPYPWQLMDEAP